VEAQAQIARFAFAEEDRIGAAVAPATSRSTRHERPSSDDSTV
jgi:hypothetical protein